MTNRRESATVAPKQFSGESEFIVPDPHIVYFDAVLNSPWNEDGGGVLPGHGDWSTYRCASKDVVIGVATHRFNRQTRRLEIRAYFVGEHPIFQAMEPTRVLMIMLCSQSYQAGGSMDLFFEQGIPFDVRLLIEGVLGERISGHELLLPGEVAQRLYAALSDFPPEMQARILAEDIPIELVCFNTYRGNWSSGQIKSLVERGVRLGWIFKNRPDPLRSQIIYAHLSNHLRAVLLEEYALYRLADRKMGVSAGKRIRREGTGNDLRFWCDEPLLVPDPQAPNQVDVDSFVRLETGERFCLVSVLPHSSGVLFGRRQHDLARAQACASRGHPILVVPLDFAYLSEEERRIYVSEARQTGIFVLVVGLTMSQLLAEMEFNLAVTAAQLDDSEVEVVNVTRYAD